MNNELEQLKREVESLKAWKRSLEASHSIPLNVDAAFRTRLATNTGAGVSSKNASSENEFIDEQGVSTHTVLKTPDGFLQIFINNTAYYVPYYS